MINAERLARIQDMMKEAGSVSVRQLMEEFDISRSSAMRDLDELQRQGFAIRKRGGALLKEKAALVTAMNESPVRQRENTCSTEKRLVAAMAAPSIQEGDCIYLDGGSTTVALVEHLQNKKVTLVTPNTFLLSRLGPDFPGKIYLLGGEYQHNYDMGYGPLASLMIRQFRFDACFMSCNGIDPANGECTVFDFGIAEVKKEIMARSTRKVLLSDHTKFGMSGMSVVSNLQDFDEIYVDAYTRGLEVPENITICKSESE